VDAQFEYGFGDLDFGYFSRGLLLKCEYYENLYGPQDNIEKRVEVQQVTRNCDQTEIPIIEFERRFDEASDWEDFWQDYTNYWADQTFFTLDYADPRVMFTPEEC